MTLGMKIARLRSENHMSQGDLAEKLNVSRQSVSKWETDASVPDLGKLIALSDLFGVSIDELVKDRESPVPPASDGNAEMSAGVKSEGLPEPKAIGSTQQIVGFIFLGTALLGLILGLALNLGILIPAAVLLLWGILCLTVRRNAGLVICWMTLVPLFLIVPQVFGNSPFFAPAIVFNPIYYYEKMWGYLAVAGAEWAVLAALLFVTLRRTKWWREWLLGLGWLMVILYRQLPAVWKNLVGDRRIYWLLVGLFVSFVLMLIPCTVKRIRTAIKAQSKKEI